MNLKTGWLVVLALLGRTILAGAVPATVLRSGADLTANRTRWRQGDARLATAVTLLRREADGLLSLAPAHVAGGHDYHSLAPYWWPNPAKPDGLPYLQRDGVVFPESRQGDMVPFARTCAAAQTLGLAYFFTGDERYAAKAASLVRIWFLAPATRMNPNLEHAQAIRGINTGRGTGIIEGRHLLELADGLALLQGAPAWTRADEDGMRTWFAAYYQWLTTGAHGQAEAKARNNHGSWWAAQAAGLAWVLGRREDVARIATAAETERIGRQFEPDGTEPLEMARTRSLNYSLFNLEALTTLARIGDRAGVRLWTCVAPNGASLAVAVAHVAPFLDPAKPWPKRDVVADDRLRILPLLIEADRQLGRPVYRAVLAARATPPLPGQLWQLDWAGD